jgi:multiple sugar transport system substrate-binding protein
MMVNGKIYGFPDDGDVFLMYYRKDLFQDAKNQSEFKDKFKYDLAPPKTWKQFSEVGQFFTDKYKKDGVYGAAFFRQPPYAQFMFQERFRNEGGKFFDGGTMKATVNSDIGVRVLTEMRNENKFMPPGVETFGFVENLATFLDGKSAMTISWPPYGRWAAGYGTDEKALQWVHKSKIAGSRPALPPGGHRNLRRDSRFRLLEQEQRGHSVHSVAQQQEISTNECNCPMPCAILSA